jgi:signal transduction histidine kinase/ActR/RegA family two-component response regulator
MSVELSREYQLALKQEHARVNLLYRQNMAGVLAQILYAVPYCVASWHVVSHAFLITWFSWFMFVGVLRTVSTILWRRIDISKLTVSRLRQWLFWLKFMLFLTGLSWGVIAWTFPQGTSTQQIFIAMSTIFLAAGCVTLYSASIPALVAVTVPGFFPWIAALLLSHNQTLQIIGIVASFYYLSGMVVAFRLNSFILNSLSVTLENLSAKEELEESKESLSMALQSSAAATWNWNLETHQIVIEGDFSKFGLSTSRLSFSEDDYLAALDPATREIVKSTLLGSGSDVIDTEHLLHLPKFGSHYMAIRGRAHKNVLGQIVSYKGIGWDATGRRSEEILRHERDVQEAANRAKSVFLANASHEMRTPLAAISGYTEALLDASLPTQIREDLQVVQRTGRYLTSLVNDFLDLSRIETGQLYIQKNPISLDNEIGEIFQMVKPAFDNKNLKLFLDIFSPLPERVETDQIRLRQILINLLSNAAKYTEKGEVRLAVNFTPSSEDRGLLSLRVSDSGVGITEQIRQNLFRPFARGETAFVKRTEGAGLGLALSRSLAQALGGDLKLVRSVPEQGSEFELTLTLEILKVPESEIPRATLPASAVTQLERPLSGMRILVAEDSEDLRELMERVLESHGAMVDSCGDGAEAVEQALKRPYDVILMDINMPVMDGYQATASLRSKGYSRPIIALTAHASIEHRQLSLEAGCDAYLSKPINSSGLIDVLKKSVQTSRRENIQSI